MKKMGGLSGLMDKLPAQFQQAASGANVDQAERQVRRMEGIINSMTLQERAKPELIKASRKRRIAAGAGVQVQEVNRMLKQFEQMQALPWGTQMLARLGAEVVKVEHPTAGESGRGGLPAVLDPQGRKVGGLFIRNNLGKKSVGIDLSSTSYAVNGEGY